MRILFDQGTPRPLRRYLRPHTVFTTYVRGWDRLENGQLLDAAEEDGFEVLITTDKNMQYQQNLKDRKIVVVILSRSKCARREAQCAKNSGSAREREAGRLQAGRMSTRPLLSNQSC